MGEASRRRKQRQSAGAAGADLRLADAIRELREALVARARAIRSGIDDGAAATRVRGAAATIKEELLGAEDEAAARLMRGIDRAERAFVGTAAALSEGMHPSSAADAVLLGIPDEESEAAVEQLMAFESFPLGSRLGAVANDREIASFVAAAITVMGPGWDPLDADPFGLVDTGAVAAGLAAVRATLLVAEALADAGRLDEMRRAIDVAGTSLTAADPPVRALLSDGAASTAWLLARAFAASASAPSGSARIVRRVGPQLPLAFAAGAAGVDWADGLETAARFEIQVAQLEVALAGVPADGLREALDAEFVLAAYAAGRAWRHGREDGWLDPWDLPAETGPAAADPAPGEGS